MTEVGSSGGKPWSLKRLLISPNWLVAILLLVIAFNEIQRTWAQAEAHRQRVELAIQLKELETKVDWLLLMQRPTSSALQLRPRVGRAPSVQHR